MRDHTKLRAFELADELAILIYGITKNFPREEIYGLTSQMRKAAVSVASNIVEGFALVKVRSNIFDFSKSRLGPYGNCIIRSTYRSVWDT